MQQASSGPSWILTHSGGRQTKCRRGKNCESEFEKVKIKTLSRVLREEDSPPALRGAVRRLCEGVWKPGLGQPAVGMGRWGRLRPDPPRTSSGAAGHRGYTCTRAPVTCARELLVWSMSILFKCHLTAVTPFLTTDYPYTALRRMQEL